MHRVEIIFNSITAGLLFANEYNRHYGSKDCPAPTRGIIYAVNDALGTMTIHDVHGQISWVEPFEVDEARMFFIDFADEFHSFLEDARVVDDDLPERRFTVYMYAQHLEGKAPM